MAFLSDTNTFLRVFIWIISLILPSPSKKSGDKKALVLFQGRELNASCYHLNSPVPHGSRPLQVRILFESIPWRCHRRPPSQPMRQAQSVRSSKTMFSNAVCTPSHQIGLSVTLFIAYSSFQRFSHMKLYLIYNGLFDLSTPTTFFIVILLEPAVGTKILPSPALFCAYVSMESR